METKDIRQLVLSTIESISPGSDVHAIAPDRPVRQQIDLDSLDWLNLIAGWRDALSVEIPPSDHERLTTLDAIVDYLASRRAPPLGEPPPAAGQASPALPHARHTINGTPVLVRPMCHEDAALEADFVRRLSTETRYQRFMVTMRQLPQGKLDYLTQVDQAHHVALAATTGTEGTETLVGVARYVVDATGTGCEFAVAVADDWQGRGLAGILMHALMAIARSRGLATMEGLVLRTNTRMLRFARQLGFKPQSPPVDRDTVRVLRKL